jgi:hypothetical protein
MTGEEWLSCADPKKMLHLLRVRGQISPRKGRLFSCACVRRIHHLLVDERSRLAVEVAEQYAEARMDAAARTAAEKGAREGLLSQTGKEGLAAIAAMLTLGRRCPVLRVLDYAAWAVHHIYFGQEAMAAEKRERGEQACLLRDCFANPLREPSPGELVLSSGRDLISRLALGAYEERQLPSGHLDPIRLAILADALDESGCTDSDILGHLRSPGPHVRGCWALDAVRDKSGTPP